MMRMMTRAVLCAAALFFSGCAAPVPQAQDSPTQMTAFRSQDELVRYLRKWIPTRPKRPPNLGEGVESVMVTAAKAAEQITNTQEAGVDEGDIVKLSGDFLVVLRQGRIYTVSVRTGELRPVDSINAYAPGVDGRQDWYDEMLVADGQIIVIGYSYGRGGTEINRFRIDAEGHLSYHDTYHVRSNDYYSSRNYASRLIGNKLVFYLPTSLPSWSASLSDVLPAMRHWSGDAKGPFATIADARQIYTSPRFRQPREMGDYALHTAVTCDVSKDVMPCRAVSVLGPEGRVFYVSEQAIYIWTSSYYLDKGLPSLLVRIPLDGGAPTGLGVSGSPVDQFAFREDAADGVLNVLVRAESAGDAMWASEFAGGAVALLRVKLSDFGDGDADADVSQYRRLPSPAEDGGSFQQRFVGDYILYGVGNSYYDDAKPKPSMLVVAPIKGGAVTQIPLERGVERIEVMGSDALVVGGDAQYLDFSAIALGDGVRRLAGRYEFSGVRQGESRSHAFYFKPVEQGSSDGVMALPVMKVDEGSARSLTHVSERMIFLRRDDGAFGSLGELAANSEISQEECEVSCVDWYGNSRPIFFRGRTIALFGFEMVEGRVGRKSIREIRRVRYVPAPKAQDRY